MQRVLIFGATSSIASEVAELHARRGDQLYLIGRNTDKLAALARRCAGHVVGTRSADFSDLDAAEVLVQVAVEALGGVDRVLIAHGALGDQLQSERSITAARLPRRWTRPASAASSGAAST